MRDFGKKHTVQLLLVISIGFLLLTMLILLFPKSLVDFEFSEEIQEHHNALLDFLMKGISWFGKTWVSISLVLTSAFMFLLKRKHKEAVFCLATLLIGVITYLIKILINRPRPGDDLVRVIVNVQHQSFPSGHVSFYISFFGFIAFLFYHKKWTIPPVRYSLISGCILLILAVPISRVYLGAHWFTDVLGGFLLGSVFLGCLLLCYVKAESSDSQPSPDN